MTPAETSPRLGGSGYRTNRSAWRAPDGPTMPCHFREGPWDQLVFHLPAYIGPVFAVADDIGKHYWLDENSDPVTYHWDGSPYEVQPRRAT